MEKSKIIKINKNDSILDISKIAYMAKEDNRKIHFILDMNNSQLNLTEWYESQESRNQWFSKISRELLGE